MNCIEMKKRCEFILCDTKVLHDTKNIILHNIMKALNVEEQLKTLQHRNVVNARILYFLKANSSLLHVAETLTLSTSIARLISKINSLLYIFVVCKQGLWRCNNKFETLIVLMQLVIW